MLYEVAYFLIFGKPLIMYLGILALLAILFTALIAILNKRKIRKIPFKWHPRAAMFAIAIALIHGILGLLLFFA